MRSVIPTLSVAFCLCFLLGASSAGAIEFNLGVSVNGGAPVGNGADLGELVVGDVLEVDLFIDNPFNDAFREIGVALLFDPAAYAVTGASTRTRIVWDREGTLVTPVLYAVGAFGPTWLESAIDPMEQSPGTWLLINADAGDGSGQGVGLGTGTYVFPGLFEETRPHASLQLTVTGLGVGDLTTGFGDGQTLLDMGYDPVPERAIFGSVTATIVPEPSSALLIALGLAAIARQRWSTLCSTVCQESGASSWPTSPRAAAPSIPRAVPSVGEHVPRAQFGGATGRLMKQKRPPRRECLSTGYVFPRAEQGRHEKEVRPYFPRIFPSSSSAPTFTSSQSAESFAQLSA